LSIMRRMTTNSWWKSCPAPSSRWVSRGRIVSQIRCVLLSTPSPLILHALSRLYQYNTVHSPDFTKPTLCKQNKITKSQSREPSAFAANSEKSSLISNFFSSAFQGLLRYKYFTYFVCLVHLNFRDFVAVIVSESQRNHKSIKKTMFHTNTM